MASLPMSACCAKGAFGQSSPLLTPHPPAPNSTLLLLDQGAPARGSFQHIAQTECYISPAPPSSSSSKILVLLTDGGGHRAPSNTTLADTLAAAGYRVFVPDLFHGNPFPLPPPPDFKVDQWIAQHTPQVVQPIVDAVLKAVRADSTTRLGVAGYCFGGGYAFRALHAAAGSSPMADCGFVAHPAATPADDVAAIARPVSIAAAENDYIFPTALRHETEAILGGKDVPWSLCVYGGTEHGFAARADLTDGRQRIARDAALSQALAFFGEHM